MWRDLFELCRAVGPVHVHVAAAVTGLRPATIRARARREGWWQPYRDVVAPPGTAVDHRSWAQAALARLGGPDPRAPRPAALCRWTGAAAYGIGPGWPTRVQVAVPVGRAPDAGRRLEVVRMRTFDAAELRSVGGLTVLAPPVLLRTLAAVADVGPLTDVLIDLVQRRATTLDAVADEHERIVRYPGRARLTAALARLGVAGRVDSSLELGFRDRFLAAGVPLDPGQVAVPRRDGGVLHLDLGIAAIRFGIEVDSMLAHATRAQLRSDVRRSNALAAIDDDWRVLRTTSEDLDAGWPDLLDLVRSVVSAQAQRHLGVPWPLSSDVDRVR